MNFEQLHSDPCIYKSKTEGDNFYLGVYVDDIVPAGESDARINKVKFSIKDLGRLTYFSDHLHLISLFLYIPSFLMLSMGCIK